MDAPFNESLIESEPDFIARLSIHDLSEFLKDKGVNMTESQKSLAETIFSHVPKSEEEEQDIILILEAIAALMKDNSRIPLSCHERQELELNRKCNEVTAQMKMLLNEITDLQSWRASFPYDPHPVEKRREIIEALCENLYEFARPIREIDFYRVLEESERNRRNQIEKHRQDSPRQ